MDIHRDKIVEVYNDKGDKVLIYKQKLRNKTLNEIVEIETDDLNKLINEVRRKVNEWNNIGDV